MLGGGPAEGGDEPLARRTAKLGVIVWFINWIFGRHLGGAD